MGTRLLFDGFDLGNYAWNVRNRSGRWAVPGLRGGNLERPGVHGALYTPGKPFAENHIVLSMWAIGANSDGSLPAGNTSRALVCRQNLDRLTRLFGRDGLYRLVQEADDGDREAWVEVAAALDLASMAGGTRAEFSVDMTVPDTFWQDTADTNQSLPVESSGATLRFTSFAGATAPLVRMTYELTGPANQPTITDPVTGQSVTLTENLAAGSVWKIDSAAWTTAVGSTNKVGSTTHKNGATLLDLTADAAGPRAVVTASSGITTATALKVTGRRRYLLA